LILSFFSLLTYTLDGLRLAVEEVRNWQKVDVQRDGDKKKQSESREPSLRVGFKV
jgi:hypothetical protein